MLDKMDKMEFVINATKIGVLGISTIYFVRYLIKEMDPTKRQKEELKELACSKLRDLKIKIDYLTDHEMVIASHLVNPSSIDISWNSIAGLDHIVKDIKQTVLFPIKNKELFSNSKLTKPPKGILLYGPPGCGKTMTAKALAKEAGMNFVNLDISILTDKWYGESQKLVAAVFSLGRKIQPCIIFIDEIDSFLRTRSSSDHEATAMMKAQFMSLWDGMLTDDSISIVMGATNRPNDLDPAILRRMPKRYPISLPSENQRAEILKLTLKKEQISRSMNFVELAKETDGFSGSELVELCRTACFRRIDNAFINSCEASEVNVLPEVTMEDMMVTINSMKDSRENLTRV